MQEFEARSALAAGPLTDSESSRVLLARSFSGLGGDQLLAAASPFAYSRSVSAASGRLPTVPRTSAAPPSQAVSVPVASRPALSTDTVSASGSDAAATTRIAGAASVKAALAWSQRLIRGALTKIAILKLTQ